MAESTGGPYQGRVIRRRDDGWDGVQARDYKDRPGDYAGITRFRLAAPDEASFELRYFEVRAGGHSSHERHRHVHVIVVLRGRGRVRLGEREEELNPGDVAIVASGEPHQFTNPYVEPFGFLCIVDRDRDRPTPIDPMPIRG